MGKENEFEYVDTQEVAANGLQIYQQDKAFIDMQISTAKAYPRNLKKAIENAITLVTMNKEIASSCTYSLKKGKTITGPSVYLARILAREMGNMRVENRVVGFDTTHVTCEAVCFDLEKNFAVRTQIKKSIVGSSGRFSEDMCTITGNAGNAIAYRNAVFAVVSVEVVNKVWEEAKKKVTGDLSDATKLMARRVALFQGFKEMYPTLNLTDEEIAASVDRSSPAHITADDIVTLIGFENSFKAGEMKPDEVFRPQTKKQPVKPNQVEDKSEERLVTVINSSKNLPALEKLAKEVNTNAQREAYDKKYAELKGGGDGKKS